jgi:hypothetical protein
MCSIIITNAKPQDAGSLCFVLNFMYLDSFHLLASASAELVSYDYNQPQQHHQPLAYCTAIPPRRRRHSPPHITNALSLSEKSSTPNH